MGFKSTQQFSRRWNKANQLFWFYEDCNYAEHELYEHAHKDRDYNKILEEFGILLEQEVVYITDLNTVLSKINKRARILLRSFVPRSLEKAARI